MHALMIQDYLMGNQKDFHIDLIKLHSPFTYSRFLTKRGLDNILKTNVTIISRFQPSININLTCIVINSLASTCYYCVDKCLHQNLSLNSSDI